MGAERAAYDESMNTTNTWPVLADALPSVPSWVAGFGVILILWFVVATILKCYVLWHAARRQEKGWFIALFFINTLGILELIYLAIHHKRPEVVAKPASWE